MGFGLACSTDVCANYEGRDIGYCRRHGVILRNTTEKDYYASMCFRGRR